MFSLKYVEKAFVLCVKKMLAQTLVRHLLGQAAEGGGGAGVGDAAGNALQNVNKFS